MKLKYLLWYAGLIAAVIFLVFGFLLKSWALSLAGFVAALFLKATNKYIPLPKIYRDKGVDNRVFEGRAKQRDEENYK